MYTISYIAPSQAAVPPTKVGPAVVTVDVNPHDVVTIAVPSAISSTHSTNASAGHVIVGPPFDIVNVCVQLTVLPHPSSAVYTISYVAPSQAAVPLTKVGPTAVTAVVTPHDADTTGVPSVMSSSHSTILSAGHSIVGPTFDIVNVCVQLSVLPHPSSTVYTISYLAPSQDVVPLTKVGPTVVTVDVNPHDVVTTGVPSTMSSAHSTIASTGHSIVGPTFDIVNT